jgi:hypothetical protein
MNKNLVHSNSNGGTTNENEDENINIELYLENHYFSQKKVEEITKKVYSVRMEEMKLEREFTKKVACHIDFVGDKKDNNGSLYELFSSTVFNINLVIYYLDKKDEPGIIDTLINLLYGKFINESFFYLPQLW